DDARHRRRGRGRCDRDGAARGVDGWRVIGGRRVGVGWRCTVVHRRWRVDDDGGTDHPEGNEGPEEGTMDERAVDERTVDERARHEWTDNRGSTDDVPANRPATKSVGEGSGRREREARGERRGGGGDDRAPLDRKSTRLNSSPVS